MNRRLISGAVVTVAVLVAVRSSAPQPPHAGSASATNPPRRRGSAR